MYTASDLSKILGVSKTTIYNDFKHFKAELEPFFTTHNRSKHLTIEGLKILKKLKGIQVEVESSLNASFQNMPESVLIERIEFFQAQVEFLKKQLEREQQLHENTQILLKQSQENFLMIEPKKEEPGEVEKKIEKNWFKRMFF